MGAERADAGTALQLAELGRKGEKLELTMRKIAVMKSRLMEMDRCPVDYAWIGQTSGFQCAGGSYFLQDGEVEGFLDERYASLNVL